LGKGFHKAADGNKHPSCKDMLAWLLKVHGHMLAHVRYWWPSCIASIHWEAMSTAATGPHKKAGSTKSCKIDSSARILCTSLLAMKRRLLSLSASKRIII